MPNRINRSLYRDIIFRVRFRRYVGVKQRTQPPTTPLTSPLTTPPTSPRTSTTDLATTTTTAVAVAAIIAVVLAVLAIVLALVVLAVVIKNKRGGRILGLRWPPMGPKTQQSTDSWRQR